ncbi:hypothetical protein BGZ83_004283, partial [Gryganskiella cystojenkinii]
MDYLLPLWLRQYLTQRQRRGTSEIPEDIADHLLAICAEALQDRDPATLSHPRTHSIHQSFTAILYRKPSRTSTSSSTSRSKFPFGASVSVFRRLLASDLDPLNSQEIVRLAIYVMKRSTLEFADPLTSERVHTEGERKSAVFTSISSRNQQTGTTASTKTGLMAASEVYLCQDFNIGQAVLHNPSYPLSRANKSVVALALFCARASGLRSKSAEKPGSTTLAGYPLTALASMAGAKWLAKLGQVMFGGPCAQQGHSHHRRTRASLELLERQNIELGQKILAEQQLQQQKLDPNEQGRRGSVVRAALTPSETDKTRDLSASSSTSDFVPLSSIRSSSGSLSHSTSISNISTTTNSSSVSNSGPALDRWCRHCSRAMSCLVLAQLQESLGVDDIAFDDSGFAGLVLSNSGFELMNSSSRSSSSSSLNRMLDSPSRTSSMGSSGFLGSSESSLGRTTNGYRDPRPHLLHKSDLSKQELEGGGHQTPLENRTGSPFIVFDRSHEQDENKPPSSIPSPLLTPSATGSASALTQSLADAFGTEMAHGSKGRAIQPKSNNYNNLKNDLPSAFEQANSVSDAGRHPLEQTYKRQTSTSSSIRSSNSRRTWEERVVEPKKTKLELDLAEAAADMSPVLVGEDPLQVSTTTAESRPAPNIEPSAVTRKIVGQTKTTSPSESISSASSNSPPSFSASASKKKRAAKAVTATASASAATVLAGMKDQNSPTTFVGLGLDPSLSSSSSYSSSAFPPATDQVISPSAEASLSSLDSSLDAPRTTEEEESPSSRFSPEPKSVPVPVPQPPPSNSSDDDRTNSNGPLEEIKGGEEKDQNNSHTKGFESKIDADVSDREREAKKIENNVSSQIGTPSSSPSSASSASSSSSSSSGSPSSSASSIRSASVPTSPVQQEQESDSSILSPESRPHTPGEYPASPLIQPLSHSHLSKDVEEEDDDIVGDAHLDSSTLDTGFAIHDEPVVSPDAAIASASSPSTPSFPEHHPFYAVGIHGQASTDSYAREIEESIKRKTPPQDTGSRRGSTEDDLEQEDGPSPTASPPVDEEKANIPEGSREENITKNQSEVNFSPSTTIPTKDTKGTLEQQHQVHYDRKAIVPVDDMEKDEEEEEEVRTPVQEGYKSSEDGDWESLGGKKDERPISSISTSSSMLSGDPSFTSSSPAEETDHGDDDDDVDDDEDDN